MLARLFEPGPLLALLGAAVAAGLVVLVVQALRRRSGAVAHAVEVGLLVWLGGFLARSATGAVLYLADDSEAAVLVAGLGLLLWPGVVEAVARLAGGSVLTPEGLMLLALVAGSVAGLMDGTGRIHRWPLPGAVTFLADVTWGLAGTTNGALVHLVNRALSVVGLATYDTPERHGFHRYRGGFRIKGTFAFTQGSVMTNMNRPIPSDLSDHEKVHVLQNRVFGPLHTLAYAGWMVLMFLPGLVAGLASIGWYQGVERLTYFNNPVEVWAYRAAGQTRYRLEYPQAAAPDSGALIWPERLAAAAGVAYSAVVALLAVLVVLAVWA